MGDSYGKYLEDVRLYAYLCKELGIKKREPYVDYSHLEELKKLPYVIYEDYAYKVDKENYPEYFI